MRELCQTFHFKIKTYVLLHGSSHMAHHRDSWCIKPADLFLRLYVSTAGLWVLTFANVASCLLTSFTGFVNT